MTNMEYVSSLIKDTDIIYIDTSALMNTDQLEIFINNIQSLLILKSKKLVVQHEVWMELQRHVEGDDTEKKDIAHKVLEILYKYRKIFYITDSKSDQYDFMKVFADSRLLAELTTNKAASKQLLITNDRDLGHDAYNLNSLESCKGYTIKVCYLNRFGELHRCDCTKENKLHTDGPRVVIKEVVKPVVKKEPYSWITKAIVPSATLLIGVVIGRRLKISL